MPLPPRPSIDCLPTETSLVESTSARNLSNIQHESAPSIPPTNYDVRSCENTETWIDWYLCTYSSISKVKALFIIYKVTAALSILGSSYIIQDILRDPQKREESTYHRIMLGLSCSDISFSFFCFFLGTWAMPRGEHLFAVGSNVTCSAAGFFSLMGNLSTLLYSCSLAAFYLLKLKYSWGNSKIKGIEKWLLFLPCTIGLIYAISAAAMSKLGPYGWGCM